MNDKPPAALALDKVATPYRLFQHSSQINSLEQAASERDQKPEQVIRSILFRLAESKFVMVLIAGPAQISWPKLRAYLGLSRISMASEKEVLDVTGYQIGAVTPLGLTEPIRILADKDVFVPEEISIGSGLRGTAIIMKSSDLLDILANIELGKFADQ